MVYHCILTCAVEKASHEMFPVVHIRKRQRDDLHSDEGRSLPKVRKEQVSIPCAHNTRVLVLLCISELAFPIAVLKLQQFC